MTGNASTGGSNGSSLHDAAGVSPQPISLQGVTIRYQDQTIVENLSFDIAGGEFIVLLGPSGSGKSTLLSAIAGLTPISAGKIWVGGRDVTALAPSARRVGMVFQSYALYPHMSVRDNLAFALKCAHADRQEIDQKVAEACRILQLEGLERRKPAALSGGQRQRVAIGRALVREVDALLLDEPLSNLDAKMRGELRGQIKQIHQRLGWTTVYVTHDQIEAMTLADRVVVLRGGRIEQIGAPKDIYDRPANVFVAGFLGSPPMNLMPAQLVVEGGAAAIELAGRRLDISDYAFATPPQPGRREILAGVRAEDFSVRDADAAGLPGTVDFAELLGPEIIVWLNLDRQRVCARVSNDRIFAPGAAVSLAISGQRLSLFDPASGSRI